MLISGNVIVIWGSHTRRHLLGSVADFCPICRRVRAHAISRVAKAGHVYYISLGRGKLLGHELICTTCHTTRMSDESFEPVNENRDATVEELEAEADPDRRQVWQALLAEERRIAAGTLSAEERREMIREVLLVANASLERQHEVRALSPTGETTIVLLIVLFVVCCGVLALTSSLFDPDLTPILVLPLVACLFATFYFMATRHAWYRRHRLKPQLIRALQPLHPTPEELDEAFAEMKRHGFRIAKNAKASRLAEWLDPRDEGWEAD